MRVLHHIVFLFFFIGSFCLKGQMPEKELDRLKSVIFSNSSHDSSKIEACINIARHFYRISALDSSWHYIELAKERAKGKSLSVQHAHINRMLGLLHFEETNWEKAAEFQLKAMEQYRQVDDESNYQTSAMNYANILVEQGKFELARDYFDDLIIYYKEKEDNEELMYAYVNRAGIYEVNEAWDSALHYIQLGLNILLHEVKDSSLFGIFYMNTGSCFQKLQQYDSAIYYLELALPYTKRFDPSSVEFTYNLLGITYLEMEEVELAKQSFQSALDTSIFYVGNTETRIEAKEQLALILGQENNFEEGYRLMAEVSKEKDVFYDKLYNQQLLDLQEQYESGKKETKITEQNLTIARQKNTQKNIKIGGGLLVLAFLGFVQYLRTRQKLRQKEAQHILQLREAEAESLRQVDKLKSRFFANISHEFRTPLNLILGPLQKLM